MAFRNAANSPHVSPARLLTWKAVRMVYAFIGLPMDATVDAVSQAVKARFPEVCPEDALPYHARDRGIVRGPLEPASSFRGRLLLWLEAWRGAGVGRALLDQLAGYLSPNACTIRLWTQIGVVYTLDSDGQFSVERAAGTWDWDGQTSLWARFWVLFYPQNDLPWARDGLWGDGGTWGTENETWGSTATTQEVASIRAIIDQWKPAGALCKNILIVFGEGAFDPTNASGLPDGTWGEYWDSASLGAHRSGDALYWKGV
jgi:hypothetical protein